MSSGAQVPVRLYLELTDSPDKKPFGLLDSIFPDSSLAAHYSLQRVNGFQEQGFLGCYRETVSANDTAMHIRIIRGFQYSWTKIIFQNHLRPFLSKTDLVKLNADHQKWTYPQCLDLMTRLAEAMNDKGYPLAQVYLDSTRIQGNGISSRLNALTGPLVLVDTLEWDKELKVNYSLLSKIIGVNSGSPYSRKAIEQINRSLAAYPFIQQYADPDIILSQNLARIRLYLRVRKSSSIDALLGLLPSSEGPLRINGTFRSDFLNQLGMGERLTIDFKSLQSNTQDLNIQAAIPFLFNLPFNPFFQFNLYRRDSLFLDVFGELGAGIALGSRAELRFVLGQKSSSLLQPDLERIRTSHSLPEALDIRLRHLGAHFRVERSEARRNPRSGYNVRFSITGSTRQIISNSAILGLKDLQDTAFSFAGLYAPFQKNSYAFEFTGELEKYTRLGQYYTWQTKLKSGIKTASTALQLNEQYRLGGFNLLRGFDEESVFSSDYYLWTNSIRLLTGELSYLQLYSDLALVHQYSEKKFQYRTCWGIGSGLVFDTSLGLLSLSAAVGKIFPDPFNLRNVKLHLGYINYF